MHISTFDILRCPYCGNRLDLVTSSFHETDGDEIHIAAQARSFLHHQVRNMAGTLKLVGLGRWQPEDVARALAARDRRAGGPTAPAEGLTLIAIDYGRE